MIEKPTILVTSVGRTGTEFFAKLFADIIPNCTSLHEPDIIKFPGVANRLSHYSQQVQLAGVWRVVFLKLAGKWTLAKLSDRRFSGKLTLSEAATRLYYQRHKFISRLPGTVYVESNLGYYGLVDVIPVAFKQHRVIYIIRDGRDWVRSMMNWGEVYGKSAIRNFFAHKWPTARDVPGDEFAHNWSAISRFEKLCWAWAHLNAYALNTISRNPHARVFKFEAIFNDANKYQTLDDLITFSISLPGIEPDKLKDTSGRLEQKVHQSLSTFPKWEAWTEDQKSQFTKICGPLMEKLGYHF